MFSAFPIARSDNAIFVIVVYCNRELIFLFNFWNVLDFPWHFVRIEYQLNELARILTWTLPILVYWKKGTGNTIKKTKVIKGVLDVETSFHFLHLRSCWNIRGTSEGLAFGNLHVDTHQPLHYPTRSTCTQYINLSKYLLAFLHPLIMINNAHSTH